MTTTTARWVKFFLDAGLPQNIATTYAITFTDHRIQIDMLPDLSKEILYDMGIRTVGDVIAILKYAKSFHGEATKEKMLGRSLPNSSNSGQAGGDQSRIGKRAITAPLIPIRSGGEAVKRTSSTALDEPLQSAKVRIIGSNDSIRGGSGSVAQDPKPFVVKMPVGATERSARILKAAVSQATSSKSPSSNSIFKRLGSDANDGNSKTPVFSRLGGATGLSTTINTSSKLVRTVPTTQNSVRATNMAPKITATVKPTNILVRSVEEAHLSAKNAGRVGVVRQVANASVNAGVKNRLGTTSSSSIVPMAQRLSLTTTKTPSRSLSSNGSALTVSTRPTIQKTAGGIVTSNAAAKRTISLKKNVFDRLGPMTL